MVASYSSSRRATATAVASSLRMFVVSLRPAIVLHAQKMSNTLVWQQSRPYSSDQSGPGGWLDQVAKPSNRVGASGRDDGSCGSTV